MINKRFTKKTQRDIEATMRTLNSKSLFRAAFLWIVAMSIGSPPTSHASGLLRAEGQYFKDAQGRNVLLRGLDLSNIGKVPPFNPLPDLSVLPKMRDWGINNIRLAFIWEAFEPKKGQYNYDYLNQLNTIVNAAGKVGITTVIDFHTDAFSRYSIGGCGSGFPEWTVPPDVKARTPSNGALCSAWAIEAGIENMIPFSGYHKTVNAFYSDTYGARTSYLEAWTQVAHYFKDNPNVIGYDLLNEPWGAEKKQLAPLYEDAAKAIRSEDPNAILMIEPFVMVGLGFFTTLPKPSFQNFAYAPHDYDLFALAFKAWFTGGLLIDNIFKAIESTSNRMNAPIYMGEYGASADGLGERSLIEHYYHLFDQHFVSGGQWDLSTWNPKTQDGWNFEDMSITDANGNLRNNFDVRPFPAAVAGKPGAISENFPKDLSQMKILSFSWENQPESGQTIFFIPKNTLGGSAFTVDFKSNDSALDCSFDSTSFFLSCSSPSSGEKKIDISIH